jgi:Domain of unknown function DUF11
MEGDMQLLGRRLIPSLLVVALLTTGCSAANDAAPLPTGSAQQQVGTAVTPTPTPTPTPAAAVANLSLGATKILTNGSVGTPSGTLKVTVTNHGSTAPALNLTFADLPPALTLDGVTWEACRVSDNGTTHGAVCPVNPIAAGASTTLQYDFKVRLGQVTLDQVGTVTVAAVGATESDPSDNSVDLMVCTNGCGG